MYIVVSDYTNEKVDISYQKFFDGMPSDELHGMKTQRESIPILMRTSVGVL